MDYMTLPWAENGGDGHQTGGRHEIKNVSLKQAVTNFSKKVQRSNEIAIMMMALRLCSTM
jgi:hypothetical protein